VMKIAGIRRVFLSLQIRLGTAITRPSRRICFWTHIRASRTTSFQLSFRPAVPPDFYQAFFGLWRVLPRSQISSDHCTWLAWHLFYPEPPTWTPGVQQRGLSTNFKFKPSRTAVIQPSADSWRPISARLHWTREILVWENGHFLPTAQSLYSYTSPDKMRKSYCLH
jgi:hypothetical protein